MSSNLKQLVSALRLDVEKVILIPDDLQKLVDFQIARFPQPAQKAVVELVSDDFLEQSERLLEAGDQDSLSESWANAQRAARYQLDEWMKSLGFEGDLSLQKKLDTLKAVGFSPRILRRLAESGLLLESDNKDCAPQEAENALDVAQLFVLTSKNAIIPLKLLIGKDENLSQNGNYYLFKAGLQFEFKPAGQICKVTAYNKLPDSAGNLAPEAIIGEVVLEMADPLYLPALRLILAAGTCSQQKEQKALRAFWGGL